MILLIFSLIFLGIKAQESVRDTHGFTDWSFGFGLGSIQFFGDLDMGQDLSSAFYLHLNKEIHSNYDLQLEFVKGDMTGKELSSNPAKIDEVFNAEFMQYDINLLSPFINNQILNNLDKTNNLFGSFQIIKVKSNTQIIINYLNYTYVFIKVFAIVIFIVFIYLINNRSFLRKRFNI